MVTSILVPAPAHGGRPAVGSGPRDGTPAPDTEILIAGPASDRALRGLPEDARVRALDGRDDAARRVPLAEVRGEVVVVLSHDAVPRDGWLAALRRPFAGADVGYVGGRVGLRFEQAPPAWLRAPVDAVLGGCDLGERPRRLRLRPGDTFPEPVNVAFRVAALRAIHIGAVPVASPDVAEACLRLGAAGWTLVYVPDATVDRGVCGEASSPAALFRAHRQRGRRDAGLDVRYHGIRRALGRIRWYHAGHLAVPPYRPAEPVDPVRVLEECRRREAVGYVVGTAAAIVRRVARR